MEKYKFSGPAEIQYTAATNAQAADLRSVREALGSKLQAALREEVGLVERVQRLEADKAALEEQVSALREGQGDAVRRLSAQLESVEKERAVSQKAAADHRLAYEEVAQLCSRSLNCSRLLAAVKCARYS